MISYLIDHLTISVFLAFFVLLVSISDVLSNKVRLIFLYLILIKLILPWGIVDFSTTLFQESMEGRGFSSVITSDMSINTTSHIYSVVSYTHIFSLLLVFCSVLSLILLLIGLVHLGFKVKKAYPCSDPVLNDVSTILFKSCGLHKNIMVMISNEIDTPFVWWNRQWYIVLPHSISHMSMLEKKVIMAHELTHIKRNDFIKFIFLKLIKKVFFFSPLVRFIISDILAREETETDLEAMRLFDIAPNHFGKTILHMISTSSSVQYPVPTLVKLEKRRLRMRLEGLFPKKTTIKSKCVQVCMILLMSVLMMFNFTATAKEGKSASTGDLINPLTSGRLTLAFGLTTHPITKKPYMHQGIDLAAKIGTDIVASATGLVLESDYDDNRGYFLVVQHDDGYKTVYTHLSKIFVAKNSKVQQGEKIATVGNTGLSTGPHLHFEIHKLNKAIDPLTEIELN